jgi:chloramphenicol O-acetyltransferase type A
MDTAEPIDLKAWPRHELFEHYLGRVPCTYAITVEVDVTELAAALRQSGRKTYISQVWALAAVVNRHEEFRMTITDAGEPAIWDVLHPQFTVFNPERETFAAVWIPFDSDFDRFHTAAADLLATHKSATTMFPQGDTPPNTFDVSSLPWTSFTGFSLQIDGGTDHLLPIFTLGRYVERDGRTLLPLAVQMHHAAADGFHIARLVREFTDLVGDPGWLT